MCTVVGHCIEEWLWVYPCIWG